MKGLSGKTIVVAGGATGIGAAVASRVAEEGANVVVGDRNVERATQTAEAIGPQALPFEFDMADDGSVKKLIDAAIERFGSLNGLHCNAMDMSAATLGRDSDLLTVPMEIWERTLAIGLTGYMLAARYALPHMIEAGGGSVVFTSSDATAIGDAERPAYSAAKGGMNAVMRHIAMVWGKEGIRANSVSPGLVQTEQLADGMSEEEQQFFLALTKSTRLGKAEDIAAAVTFLLSDDAEWINGQVYSINGGLYFRP